jgi:predicted kinase
MCPDDWMNSAGIDLWDSRARARIERCQLDLTIELLGAGLNVVVEWGVWAREERDALRDAARAVGGPVELRHLSAPVDELWGRLVARHDEGRWLSRPISRGELEEWADAYEPPTDEELALYDPPAPP